MDFSKLRTGELIAGISGVLLLITIFLFDWYGVGGAIGEFASAAGVDTGVNAWNALDVVRFLLILTALAGIGLAVLGATGRSVALPWLPASSSRCWESSRPCSCCTASSTSPAPTTSST